MSWLDFFDQEDCGQVCSWGIYRTFARARSLREDVEADGYCHNKEVEEERMPDRCTLPAVAALLRVELHPVAAHATLKHPHLIRPARYRLPLLPWLG